MFVSEQIRIIKEIRKNSILILWGVCNTDIIFLLGYFSIFGTMQKIRWTETFIIFFSFFKKLKLKNEQWKNYVMCHLIYKQTGKLISSGFFVYFFLSKATINELGFFFYFIKQQKFKKTFCIDVMYSFFFFFLY